MQYKTDYSRLLYFILSDHHVSNRSSFNNPGDFFVNIGMPSGALYSSVLVLFELRSSTLYSSFIFHSSTLLFFYLSFIHSPFLTSFIHPLSPFLHPSFIYSPLSSIFHSSTLPFFYLSFIHSPFLLSFIHPLCLSYILHSSTLPFFYLSFIHSAFLLSFIHPLCLSYILHSSTLPFFCPSFIYSPLSYILHSSTLPFFRPSFTHSPFLPSFIHPLFLSPILHSSISHYVSTRVLVEISPPLSRRELIYCGLLADYIIIQLVLTPPAVSTHLE